MEERAPQGDTQHHVERKDSPSGRLDRPLNREGRIWIWVESHGGREVRIAKPGLFSAIMALLLLGLATAIALAILLSIFFIWIPVLGGLLAALILWRAVRGR
jgi:hypothetical protein